MSIKINYTLGESGLPVRESLTITGLNRAPTDMEVEAIFAGTMPYTLMPKARRRALGINCEILEEVE